MGQKWDVILDSFDDRPGLFSWQQMPAPAQVIHLGGGQPKGFRMKIDVFNTVGAVSVEVVGEFLAITQIIHRDGMDDEFKVIAFPKNLAALFTESIKRALDGES